MGRKSLIRSAQNIALGDIRDIITDANFGDDRLRGFSVEMGQILGFKLSPSSLQHSCTTVRVCDFWWQSRELNWRVVVWRVRVVDGVLGRERVLEHLHRHTQQRKHINEAIQLDVIRVTYRGSRGIGNLRTFWTGSTRWKMKNLLLFAVNRGDLLRLNYNKTVFGRGSARTPLLRSCLLSTLVVPNNHHLSRQQSVYLLYSVSQRSLTDIFSISLSSRKVLVLEDPVGPIYNYLSLSSDFKSLTLSTSP